VNKPNKPVVITNKRVGKGSRNRSASRKYWESSYWEKKNEKETK